MIIKAWFMDCQLGGPPALPSGAGFATSATEPYADGSFPALPYHQNVMVPDGNVIVLITGTITVRAPGAFLLMIMCNRQMVWKGELECRNWQPQTLFLSIPIPASWNLCGSFYVNYQSLNYTNDGQNDGAFLAEYQLGLYGQ
jgi:hypothetical protein